MGGTGSDQGSQTGNPFADLGGAGSPPIGLTSPAPNSIAPPPGEILKAGRGNLKAMADAAAAKYGVDPAPFWKATMIESKGDPNAHNASGATGVLQFMPKTAKAYGLSNPRDPAASFDAGARLWRDNSAYLEKRLGRPPTGGELYLAHQQGAGGAAALLSNPDKPAASIVGRAAVVQNGGKADMSARDFAGLWTSKFGNSPAVSPTFDAMSRPSGSAWAPGSSSGPGGAEGTPDLWASSGDTSLAVPDASQRGRGGGGTESPEQFPGGPEGRSQHDFSFQQYMVNKTTRSLHDLSPAATIDVVKAIGAAIRGGMPKGGSA